MTHPSLSRSLALRKGGRATKRTVVAPLLCLVLLSSVSAGCAFYSFTGATIPGHLATVAIPLVEDNSANPLTALDEQLTDLLVQRFVRQTRLSFVSDESEADALVTAQIQSYRNEPTSVTGEERATLNRVTLTISARYYDQLDEEVLMERQFSASEEYDPVTEGLDGEQRAAQSALEDIADDVFTAATSDW